MPMRTLLTICLALLYSFGAAAQTTADPSYGQLVQERCPGADIVKVQRADFDLLEVEYFCQGRKVELGIHDGVVVYEEREGEPDAEAMLRIRRSLDKKYPGWLMDEVSLITAKDSTFVKAEVVMDGVEVNVYFTTIGRKFNPRSMLAAQGWSVEELAAVALPGAPYDLLAPDSTYALPELLREVSAIAIAGPNSVFCVQDELGAVFEYDVIAEAIVQVHRFTDVGDFEGIAVQGDRIIVLRSDGKLYTLDRATGALLGEQQHSLPSLNNEGLYVAGNGDLHVVSKEASVVGDVHVRAVHRIHHDRVELHHSLDADEVAGAFARSYPTLGSRKVRFSPSAAGVHPITGQLYVLSAADRLLTIYGDSLQYVLPLPAAYYYKPEGLAFHPNGDLLISNEGDKKGLVPANIMRFRYRD